MCIGTQMGDIKIFGKLKESFGGMAEIPCTLQFLQTSGNVCIFHQSGNSKTVFRDLGGFIIYLTVNLHGPNNSQDTEAWHDSSKLIVIAASF